MAVVITLGKEEEKKRKETRKQGKAEGMVKREDYINVTNILPHSASQSLYLPLDTRLLTKCTFVNSQYGVRYVHQPWVQS